MSAKLPTDRLPILCSPKATYTDRTWKTAFTTRLKCSKLIFAFFVSSAAIYCQSIWKEDGKKSCHETISCNTTIGFLTSLLSLCMTNLWPLGTIGHFFVLLTKNWYQQGEILVSEKVSCAFTIWRLDNIHTVFEKSPKLSHFQSNIIFLDQIYENWQTCTCRFVSWN